MTQIEQQKAAKEFAEFWSGKGDEKQESQRFWIDLLQNVLGVANPAKYIEFEKPVKLSHTSYIDAYIAATKVLIEQKGSEIDLRKAYEQSDGQVLTPYQQAKRYVGEMKASEKPRWIVVCNFAEFLVYDLEVPNGEPQQILLKDLEKDFYRLQFLVDQRNDNIRREEELSLQAGILVGKLYDALVKEYINPDEKSLRSLNILCVRIVFCLYAEDAGLFETRTAFEDYIKSFATENLRDGIIKLFKALDTKISDRDKYDAKLQPFPYVNGGLFRDEQIEIPNFTQDIVDVIVNHCAPFNWSEISPTIFGSVFESTLNPETRRKGGMHYTSVANIHKVIDPLFMDDLNAEFEEICKTTAAKTRDANLFDFQKKLGSLKFLDPACGSGNFLTETYLSLRRLENKSISILNRGEKALGFDECIKVNIGQFYGIEINDFAVTVAKTALWIAESQMVAETEKILSQNINFLPLTNHANIIEGNALRLDWATLSEIEETGFLFTEKLNVYKMDEDFGNVAVHDSSMENGTSLYGRKFKELNVVAKEIEEKELPKNKKSEPVVYDYIMGNPPFVGFTYMSAEQKSDMQFIFPGVKNLDYVCAWYKKASDFIQGCKTQCAFVSTNSITQGETVARFVPFLKIKFDFAYRTFIWDSESAQKAHVHCVIIGFSANGERKEKIIIDEDGNKNKVSAINAYLVDAPNIIVDSRNKPLCNVSKMVYGNKPADGGFLIIEEDAYEDFIRKDPGSKKFVRPFVGAVEFLHSQKRYCLWLEDASPAEIKKCPLVYERVKKCKESRESSIADGIRKFADTPHLFAQRTQPQGVDYIIVPRVSSENRRYVPMDFMTDETIVSDAVQIVPSATLYEFGVMTSNVHMAWMRAVCGRLESRYRYSKDVVYNNFPWPSMTDAKKSKIEKSAQNILDARAKYPDSSLADLYDESLMPPDLRKAHRENDKAVMQAYGFKQAMEESEIVAELFKMYEKLAK